MFLEGLYHLLVIFIELGKNRSEVNDQGTGAIFDIVQQFLEEPIAAGVIDEPVEIEIRDGISAEDPFF